MAKRKRKLRKQVKILMIAAVLLLCGGCGWLVYSNVGKKKTAVIPSSVTETELPEETVEPTPEPVVSNASLFMIGDTLLHDPIEIDAAVGDGTYNFTLLDRVGEIARNYDLRYWNNETVLGGDELGISGYPQFNGVQAWGDYMISMGFNMTSLANNHSLDMGMYGLTNNLNYWNSHPEVVNSGTYLSWEDYNAIPIHEINGITYAFISYTYGMNGLYPPEGQEYAVACYEGRVDELMNKVSQADQLADVVIVAMHWGTEYQLQPNEEQTTLAVQLSDAGADIIIGNHPHCIEPIDWINDRTICFYALGNACAGQYDESRIEMMAALNIQKTEYADGTVEIELQDIKADLMYCWFDDYTWDFEVVPFAQMDENYTHLSNWQEVYDQYKPLITQMTDKVQVGGF